MGDKAKPPVFRGPAALLCELSFFVSNCGWLSRDVGEYRGKIGADKAGRSDDHDRDESGNQTIFNGSDPYSSFAKRESKKLYNPLLAFTIKIAILIYRSVIWINSAKRTKPREN